MIFSLELFGGASLTGESGPLTGPAAQRHRVALLALLATSHPRALTRDKLMACLWPERDSARARHLLNQAVYHLRKALGEEAILSAGDELRFDPRMVQCDVILFEEALAAGDLQRAVALYQGPFLDGFFLSEAPEFEQWVEGERERFRRACCKALEGLAEEATAGDDPSSAVEWCRRLTAEEPYNGRVTMRLMEALESSGDRGGAIQQARAHSLLLQEEFGAEPDPQVTALAERLRTEPAVPDAMVEPAPERRREEGNGVSRSATLPPRRLDFPASSPAVAHPAGIRRPPPRPARRWATALVLLGLGGLAVLLMAFWLRQSGSPTLHPQRVVVAPFENRTGDPALDPLGSMAADWITQGLSHTAIVEVVPTSAALTSARHVKAGAGSDPLHALAEETGAGIVVSGAFYRTGDSLQFQARITDARQGRQRMLEPIGAAASAPVPAIELLRQRTLGGLAPLLDTRLAAHAQLASQPPSYEAYRAYAEGMEIFIERRWRESIPHFERAAGLDSSYLLPRLVIAIAHANLGAAVVADSIGRDLNESRERLAPYDRAVLDLLLSWLGDDRAAMYEAAKRAAALAPGSLPHVQWGVEALRLNRPREAIEILTRIDPTRGEVRGWATYWQTLASAHHLLGDHQRELIAVRRARALHPDDPAYLLLEAVALAALGQVGEVWEVVGARLAFPAQRYPDPLSLMVQTGHELRVHGHTDAADEMFARAVAWYRRRPAAEQARYRPDYGFALIQAGQWREAEAVFRELAGENPEAVGPQGTLGILAAQRGDQAEAERISAWLAAQRRPYLTGNHTFFRACIEAQLGRRAEAVALLQEAFGQGAHYWPRPHTMPCFEPLRDHPPFRELLRPKG